MKSILVLSVFFCIQANGQKIPHEGRHQCQKANLSYILDSLKDAIFMDTVKFQKSDLIKSAGFIENKNSYSSLFVVNGKYYYKLDVSSNNATIQFVNQFLKCSNVKCISILKQEDSLIYGSRGKNGVVFISLNKRARFNPIIDGFNGSKKKGGSNDTFK